MGILPILTNHSIEWTGSCLSTAPEEFKLQVGYFASKHYQTLTVRRWLGKVRTQ